MSRLKRSVTVVAHTPSLMDGLRSLLSGFRSGQSQGVVTVVVQDMDAADTDDAFAIFVDGVRYEGPFSLRKRALSRRFSLWR